MTELPAEIETLQRALLPIEWERPAEPAGHRLAAVLILLFPSAAGWTFLLTERPTTLSHHPGQISLPGGALEPHDAHLAATALRETEEELGVTRASVRLLGSLPSLLTHVTGFEITPIVAWTPAPPALRPHPDEVETVIEAQLACLLDPESIDEEEWELRGRRYLVTFYRLSGHIVWGITAMILSELAERLGAPLPGSPPGSVRPA
jgi:8-oxo-dGTP pyrophosphatase MutT (NUDIX family)